MESTNSGYPSTLNLEVGEGWSGYEMKGRRRAGGVGMEQDVIGILHHVMAQSALENGVR